MKELISKSNLGVFAIDSAIARAAFYGIGGLYNYGCEAIVRGTVRLLQEAYPGTRVQYFSPRAEDDAKRVSDLGIDVVQLKAGHRSVPLRALNKAAQALCVPFDSTREDYESVLDTADVLVSIGGDIYTIPAYKRENRRYPYFNKVVRMGELAVERGIPELIIGASIGPFGDYGPAVDYYAEHLRSVDLICCREQRSVDYLASIGVSSNVCLIPDPAFFVEGKERGDTWAAAEYLGINLSPLSLRELNGGVSSSDVSRLSALISVLMDQTGMPALFVPHVIATDPSDNDLLFLHKIADAMDVVHQAHVEVVEPTCFLDAKRYLRCCKLVVAARMHCAVNAMCEGVPTILLSYSTKAIGMCEFVYGNNYWTLPLSSAGSELPAKMATLQVEADSIHAGLVRRVSEIRASLSGSAELGRVIAVLSVRDSVREVQ